MYQFPGFSDKYTVYARPAVYYQRYNIIVEQGNGVNATNRAAKEEETMSL